MVQSVTKDSSGQVTAVTAELNPGGDFKKTKLKLTWLADVPELVPLVLTEFDYLITKKKVRAHERSIQALSLAVRLLPREGDNGSLGCVAFPELVPGWPPHSLKKLVGQPCKVSKLTCDSLQLGMCMCEAKRIHS